MEMIAVSCLKYFLLPLTLSFFLTPLVRNFSIKKGYISYPRADRWHKNPTAIMGGIAIFAAFLISSAVMGIVKWDNLGFILGGVLLFIVGLIDDRFHIAPYTKLLFQIIAACVAVLFGKYLGFPINNPIFIPFAIFWIVGITNSFNLLDNIDGLCAGVAVISSMAIFFTSLNSFDNPLGIFSLMICAVALGFLPYNFNPAKIFMGDCGSMFLGYSMAVISISGRHKHISSFLITMIIPVIILSVPIFDTLFVMVIRKLQGKRMFEGDKDHTSHRLVFLGLSAKKTVVLLYFISAIFGAIAVLYSKVDILIVMILGFLGAVILSFFGIFLSDATKALKSKKAVNTKAGFTALNTLIIHKRRFMEVLMDLGLICIAYYGAYYLRFEGILLNSNSRLLTDSIIWVILVKMCVFFSLGLYRGVWKYLSVSDLITIFKAVCAGSVVSVLFLTFVFRFRDYSRAVFFIDWLILLFLVSGSRISFRLLGEFFSRLREKGKNVLIYGAGDTGEMVIREIKRNRTLNYNPIGFLDDDPAKIGNKIQGLTVLGSRAVIKNLAKLHNIKEIIIAVPSLNISDLSEIIKVCKEYGISYRRVRGILDTEKTDDKFIQN